MKKKCKGCRALQKKLLGIGYYCGLNHPINGGTSMDFLANLDSETLKAELLAFLELGDDEFDISSMGEFVEQFVDFIKDDLSYAD